MYDPLDHAFLDDPFPAYRRMRDHAPVSRNERLDCWAFSRFEDVWDAVRDTAAFSSASGLTFHPDEIGGLGLAPTIVMLDPPRHTRLRALVGHGFTPRRTRELEDRIRGFAAARIRDMERAAADGAAPDLHRDFSSPLPTFVLADLLGVPEADRGRFDPWVRALVEIGNDGFALGAAASAKDAVAEMFAYFGDLVRARRADPGDDLISALTQAEIDGDRLTDWDVLGFCFVMVAGGNDTTGNLVSNGVMLLDGDHAQRERLARDPALIPNAVLEFLRLEGPVQALARTTTREVTAHGVTIPPGSKVMMLYGSANRDEREFGPDAERLDVTRDIKRHLGFATGPHFCVGSHLARLQARVAFEELLRRHPHAGVDTANGVRLRSAFARGWISLPVTGLAPA
ncbi:cytochrome P450 [Bailinhaonella thermotolerans]|uniref:cytochrome P450 n=1 Tax=Bailinhaonella thermotolerans TaxID=1070861 RepID=UPI001F5BFAC7|nr:cytochrome P450 [Bailinhaonella thermotolerans]